MCACKRGIVCIYIYISLHVCVGVCLSLSLYTCMPCQRAEQSTSCSPPQQNCETCPHKKIHIIYIYIYICIEIYIRLYISTSISTSHCLSLYTSMPLSAYCANRQSSRRIPTEREQSSPSIYTEREYPSIHTEREERWGAGVEYHFQEFKEPYAPS